MTTSYQTRIGALQFTHEFADGYPSDETVERLYDERDFQRACQAYLWALPIVSFAQWQYSNVESLGAENGQIVVARLDDEVTVRLPGGQLVVSWRGNDEPVWLTGDAEHTSEGTIDL